MARHRLAGAWSQIQEQAKLHWGQLPNDGFDEVECRRDSLAGLIQERYGVEQDEAERQIDPWLNGSMQGDGDGLASSCQPIGPVQRTRGG